MTNPASTLLTLVEYQPRRLPQSALSEALGTAIWRRYSTQLSVEFPSPKTGHEWQLTAQGWVGVLPVSEELTLVLQPKTSLHALWSLLAYAFGLQALDWRSALVGVTTLPGLYEQLAAQLAQQILARTRRGLYQAYVPRTEQLATVRGRVDPTPHVRHPWQATLRCHYEEQTTDVEENQLLGWTLLTILQSGICSERTHPLVQRAFHRLRPAITLRPFSAAACRNRHYHRYNRDYAALHALCGFFLAQRSPAIGGGHAAMIPFCVPMATVYERSVAAWLGQHLGPQWQVQAQERYVLDPQGDFSLTIDLVIREQPGQTVRWVLDTKYKNGINTPSAEDLAQIIAYAQATGAPEAILIYPVPVRRKLDLTVGAVRIRSLSFAIDRPIEQAGQEFLAALLNEVR